MPYTTDSHYGEYIGWARDVVNKIGIKRFYTFYKLFTGLIGKRIRHKIRNDKGNQLVKPDHERAIPIIEGILSDDNHHELSVNLPNKGIISNLPEDLVVECPATVNKSGVHGNVLGVYPEPLVNILKIESTVQDLVVNAIIHKSRDFAVQALQADPNFPRKHFINEFLDEMVEIQKEWISLE